MLEEMAREVAAETTLGLMITDDAGGGASASRIACRAFEQQAQPVVATLRTPCDQSGRICWSSAHVAALCLK